MGGQKALSPTQHRRRRTALWLLAIGGGLLLVGIIALIVSPSAAAPRPEPPVFTPTPVGTATATPSPSTAASSPPAVAAGSSPLNATNVFGGTTAFTGLVAACTGLLAYRASRHQPAPIVYVVAAQPPAGAAPVPGLDKPQAAAPDPAKADKRDQNGQAP